MRVLIQRVSEAAVAVDGEVVARIGAGMLLLVGVEEADGAGSNGAGGIGIGIGAGAGAGAGADEDIEWLVGKIARLRIFDDEAGVMNLDILQTGGEVLAISQFTLHASTRKGNRPSYIRAARPEIAEPIYERFVARLSRELGEYRQTGSDGKRKQNDGSGDRAQANRNGAGSTGNRVKTGIFGADMQVSLTNDGPVTILIDSKNRE